MQKLQFGGKIRKYLFFTPFDPKTIKIIQTDVRVERFCKNVIETIKKNILTLSDIAMKQKKYNIARSSKFKDFFMWALVEIRRCILAINNQSH